MIDGEPVQTTPLDPERKRFLEQRAAEAIRKQPLMAELLPRLLAVGGEAAAFTHYEPFVEQLVERGQAFPRRSRLKYGRPIGCHENVALLWNKNREEMSIVTGYALSEDGVWRQHSWIALQVPGRRAPIIETTMKRLLYFGFILTPAEAERFVRPYLR